jgi:hypothetical protein
MTLNEEIPGLPAWPPIEQLGDHEYLVSSKHIPYEKYNSGCGLIFSIPLIVVVPLMWLGVHGGDASGDFFAVMFLFYFFLAMVLGILNRIFRSLLYSQKIRIRFTPSQIFVNKQAYQVGPPVQFRANRPSLDEGDYQTMWDKVQSGKVSFKAATIMHYRRIEMVHGARLVLITSMADQERAEQFAAGLQCAYALATSQPIHPRGGNINIGEMPE